MCWKPGTGQKIVARRGTAVGSLLDLQVVVPPGAATRLIFAILFWMPFHARLSEAAESATPTPASTAQFCCLLSAAAATQEETSFALDAASRFATEMSRGAIIVVHTYTGEKRGLSLELSEAELDYQFVDVWPPEPPEAW